MFALNTLPSNLLIASANCCSYAIMNITKLSYYDKVVIVFVILMHRSITYSQLTTYVFKRNINLLFIHTVL